MGIAAKHREGIPGTVGGDGGDLPLDLVVDHVPGDVLDAQEQPHGVDLQDPLEVGLEHVVDMGVAPDAHRVDEDVQGAQGLVDIGHQIHHLVLLRHIGLLKKDTAFIARLL